MFMITPDQDYILSVLQKTKIMKCYQACMLLNKLDGRKTEQYALRCLGQLRHIRKIVWKTDGIITLPLLYNEPDDAEMLSAIDVMLDVTDFKILSVSAGAPPYKLSFLTEQDNELGSYAVIIVNPGTEAMMTASLCGAEASSRTVIFLLSELSQKEGIKTAAPHFFAIYDGGKYRYFRG